MEKKNKILVGGFMGTISLVFLYYISPIIFPSTYIFPPPQKDFGNIEVKQKEIIATHLPTPNPLKGIYMTSWVAGTQDFRNSLIKLIDETEINTIVIDIKDDTGRISFEAEDSFLKETGSSEKRIPDIKEFLEYLHSKDIYIIGRISVFQDPYLVKKRPELAVKKKSTGEVWKDYKGISWLDAGSPEVWDYIVAIGKESYKKGFDELNFDYIRFPSDGNMEDIFFPFSDGKIKSEVIEDFFRYLTDKFENHKAVLSADLFGMTTTNNDDLNIGQVLEIALKYFDYVLPMVYPSHYPPTFRGFQNPADFPYEIVKFSMDEAVKKALNASSSPQKLRPWLQDFDLGAIYTPEMVRAQIQATYDSGLSSWLLWDASNTYTQKALDTE